MQQFTACQLEDHIRWMDEQRRRLGLGYDPAGLLLDIETQYADGSHCYKSSFGVDEDTRNTGVYVSCPVGILAMYYKQDSDQCAPRPGRKHWGILIRRWLCKTEGRSEPRHFKITAAMTVRPHRRDILEVVP